jgi:probable HAF family extracellular repeat protein
MVGLGDLQAVVHDISADGSVIVGFNNSPSRPEAFLWTSGGGMVGLGDLPGGLFESKARAISADGSNVVGQGCSASGYEAFIWDATSGMRKLSDVLSPRVRTALDGWILDIAFEISADGRAVVGWGTNPTGNTEAWVAYLGTEVPESESWMLAAIAVTITISRCRRSAGCRRC